MTAYEVVKDSVWWIRRWDGKWHYVSLPGDCSVSLACGRVWPNRHVHDFMPQCPPLEETCRRCHRKYEADQAQQKERDSE